MASFFTPASKKAPEVLTWRTVNKSLVVGKYKADKLDATQQAKRLRVAAFDLDDTLITSTVGNKWVKAATGWKWWDVSVPSKLKALDSEG